MFFFLAVRTFRNECSWKKNAGRVVEENRETYLMTQGMGELNKDVIKSILDTGNGIKMRMIEKQ